MKLEIQFTEHEWKHAAKSGEQGQCKERMERAEQGMWECKGCNTIQPKTKFSEWLQSRVQLVCKPNTRCNACKATAASYHGDQQRKLTSMVVKHKEPTPVAVAGLRMSVQVSCPQCFYDGICRPRGVMATQWPEQVLQDTL